MCLGIDGADGQVQDAAAADRHELMPVTEQRKPNLAFVGDGEQGAGDVLIRGPERAVTNL